MQTLQPTLRLGRDVWDRTAMPIEEYRSRADRLRTAMADRGLDTLLLYGANLNGCGHPTYLANYIVKLPFAALVVLPREGEPALMFQGATRGRSAAQATTWIEDVRPCWNMAETCLAVLAERGLLDARIGLAAMPRLVPHHDWATLAAGLRNATLVDAEELVNRQRAIKSSREIAHIHRAARIVQHGIDVIPQIAASAGEQLVVAHIVREVRMRGAEDVRILIARTQEAEWAFRPVEDVPFHDGDTASVLLSASRERYWCESIRTFRVAADRFEPVWSAEIDTRFRTLTTALRPGITTAAWSRVALEMLTAREDSALAPYSFGGGIGVTPEEWPLLSVEDETTIAPGMCFAVRTAFETRDRLILHGETIVVQE